MLCVNDLLGTLVTCEASDLHLRVGEHPVLRHNGRLRRIEDTACVTDIDMDGLVWSMLNDEQRERFYQNKELDASYDISGLGRFRANFFRQQGHVGAVLHKIPTQIRSLDSLLVPPIVKELCLLPRGVLLVTGPTGTGKSTTLAAMVDYINENRTKHIISIEEPIEFVHNDKLSAVEQREVGSDTHSFAAALKHIMRQNPDVIMVGEMRDLETVHLAITAAETGHLVCGTLHTVDAPQTIDRIVDVFDPMQQSQVRLQLAITLQAVISQTLLRRSDGMGQIAAFEVMVVTPAIRNLIRENHTSQIYTHIATGAALGMQSMDTHLLHLALDGTVEYDDAIAKAHNPEEFESRYIKAIERRGTTAQAA